MVAHNSNIADVIQAIGIVISALGSSTAAVIASLALVMNRKNQKIMNEVKVATDGLTYRLEQRAHQAGVAQGHAAGVIEAAAIVDHDSKATESAAAVAAGTIAALARSKPPKRKRRRKVKA
jgi:hypothetical protein